MKQNPPPNYQRYIYSKLRVTGSNYRELLYREFRDDSDHQRRVYGSFKAQNDYDLRSGEGIYASGGKRIYDLIQNTVESVMAAFLLLLFAFNVSIVSGSSMEPTMAEQDRVIVQKLFYTPDYGDVAAIWAENLPNRDTGRMGEMIVKRIIGLEGDVIDIDPETGTVYRNGEPLIEDYIKEPISPDNLGNAKYPLTVDKGCVFVLGDNRNRSTDSRYMNDGLAEYYVGCIDQRCIAGRVVFRILPFDRIGVIE